MPKSGDQIAAKELRERGEPELRSLLSSKQEELHKARFKHALGQLRQTHGLRNMRRDIARLTTILGERTRSAKAEG